MRPKFLIFIALISLGCLAHADNAITFYQGLPRPWALLSSQAIPGTNAVTHVSFNANVTVIQDKTNLTTMMISVAPVAAQSTNDLTLEARNWVHSVLSRFGENLNLGI